MIVNDSCDLPYVLHVCTHLPYDHCAPDLMTLKHAIETLNRAGEERKVLG